MKTQIDYYDLKMNKIEKCPALNENGKTQIRINTYKKIDPNLGCVLQRNFRLTTKLMNVY